MADFNRDRVFETGADRSSDAGKPHPNRAWSILVLRRFSEYMYDHNVSAKVSRREDQWQLGFPQDSFVESGSRHFDAWQGLHRGIPTTDEKGNPVDLEEALCGLLFNVQGYLHEILLAKLTPEEQERIREHVRQRNLRDAERKFSNGSPTETDRPRDGNN